MITIDPIKAVTFVEETFSSIFNWCLWGKCVENGLLNLKYCPTCLFLKIKPPLHENPNIDKISTNSTDN